ncbi:flagellar motor protein MotB [Priestia filamentosa]|uniref:flagellar motor protein MotB n=1 Tax=Priestia filamentosa TaxID=1402861 RepID=UPI000A9BEC19
MSKKHKKHEEHVDESWLVPYADVLTLLLALFIVLFAMSSVDSGKYKQLMLSLNEEFKGGTGQEEFLSAEAAEEAQELKEQQAAKAAAQSAAQKELERKLREQDMQELRQLKRNMDNYIKRNKLSLSLKTTLTERGLMLTILDNALFESGKAYVKPDAMKLAKEISKLLVSKPPREIMVSGHTDNVPISNSEFSSNWDLSSQRAVNFMEILLQNTELSPEKFSALGKGEFHPVASNSTKEGKAKNRRVEVLILPLTNTELIKLNQAKQAK